MIYIYIMRAKSMTLHYRDSFCKKKEENYLNILCILFYDHETNPVLLNKNKKIKNILKLNFTFFLNSNEFNQI